MRRPIQQLALGALSLTLGLAQSEAGHDFAVMNHSVRVTVPTEVTFHRLQENQILPCYDMQDESFGVVARDTQGHVHLARLPRRDPWGRATAKAWPFDSRMASNTVKILVPVPLSSGQAFFPAGSRHPVVNANNHTLDILYQFADFEGVFTVPRTAATIETPPPPVEDPNALKEQALQATLQAAVEQQHTLKDALRQAHANAIRIQTLRRDLALTQIESRRLRTELLETQHGVRQALHTAPEDDPALAQRQSDLDHRLRERTATAMELAARTQAADALNAVEKHMAVVERDVMRIEKAAAQQRAELKALRTVATDSHGRQEADDVVRLVRLALAQQETVAAEITQVEAVTQRLSPWFETLTLLAHENEALRERLETLQAKLVALREAVVQAEP